MTTGRIRVTKVARELGYRVTDYGRFSEYTKGERVFNAFWTRAGALSSANEATTSSPILWEVKTGTGRADALIGRMMPPDPLVECRRRADGTVMSWAEYERIMSI